MASFLVDSSVLISALRRDGPDMRWLQDAASAGHELAVCPVVETELFRGAHPNERERLEALLVRFACWPLEREDGRAAGIRRYELARLGFQLHLADSLIAAVASRRGATVVTRNTKDFERLGVPVVDPSAEAQP